MSYTGLHREDRDDGPLGVCEVCGADLEDRGGYEEFWGTPAWKPEVVCPNDCPPLEDWEPSNEFKLDEQPIVYVAGPYTSAPEKNTLNAIAVAEELAKLGFVPYIPHLTHYWDQDVHRRWGSRKSPTWWYEYDNVFLAKCDVMFRILGKSTGADNEELLAKKLGIPVFTSVPAMVAAKNRGELC